MLVTSDNSPADLRKSVTSPNGTTFAALQTFEKLGLDKVVDAAVKASANRGAELGEEFGK